MPDSSNLWPDPYLLRQRKRKPPAAWDCAYAQRFGFRVLIYQFMKNNSTSEILAAMAHIENITFLPAIEQEKFGFRMSEEKETSPVLCRAAAAHR